MAAAAPVHGADKSQGHNPPTSAALDEGAGGAGAGEPQGRTGQDNPDLPPPN